MINVFSSAETFARKMHIHASTEAWPAICTYTHQLLAVCFHGHSLAVQWRQQSQAEQHTFEMLHLYFALICKL